MLKAINIELRYGSRVLFKDVNLEFTGNNCYGIIGATIYFLPYLVVFLSEWRYKTENLLSKLFIVLLIRFLIFEYSTITYNMLMYVVILTVLICGNNIIKAEKEGEV